jgi:hypothetical protein
MADSSGISSAGVAALGGSGTHGRRLYEVLDASSAFNSDGAVADGVPRPVDLTVVAFLVVYALIAGSRRARQGRSCLWLSGLAPRWIRTS